MKASILRKFYLTFVKLYGVIFYSDAYEIIRKFYPDLKKSAFLKDLKDRNGKMTRGYAVLRTGDRKDPYLICDEFLSDEDIDNILYQQGKKPFFVCGDLEEYFEYAYTLGYNPGFQPMVDFARKKMKKKVSNNEAKLLSEMFVAMLCEKIHSDCGNAMKNINESIQKTIDVLELQNEAEVEQMLGLFMNLQKNVKMFTNRGYSPVELREILPPGNPENLVINIGDNMRNSMMDDDFDLDGIIEDIKNNKEMPEKMKNDLLRQFEEIKTLKENKAKA